MKAPQTNTIHRIADRCVACGQKILAQIQRARNSILEEFRSTLAVHDKMLRLALNEAEALAWETEFPHLFFPDLAREKAMAVAAWDSRQQLLRRSRARHPFAT